MVAPGPSVRALVVRIRAHHRSFAGRITVREPDGTSTERAVAGESCAQVMTALALIAAVAVDPTAASSGGTAAASATAASSTPPASSSSAAPAASSSSAPTSAPPASASPPPPPPPPPKPDEPNPDEPKPPDDAHEEPSPAPPPRPGTWGFAVGAHAGAIDGVAPDVLLLLPIFVEAAREGSFFAPAARLRFDRSGSGTVSSGGASAQFTWTAAALDLCPIKLGAGRFDARPCLRFEGGSLAAAGVDVQPSRSGARPWLSTGAAARGRFVVIGPLFLEAEAALGLALVRDRFFVEPSQTVFKTPLVGWSATGGVGVQFR